MFRRIVVASVLIACILLLVGFSHVPTADAGALIVVNSLGDSSGHCASSGRGTCTLRDALTYANTQAGQNTISFSKSGAITLGLSLPTITDSLIVNGSGKNQVVVSGGGMFRVFNVASGAKVTVTNLTITNGVAVGDCFDSLPCGGGIKNNGTLTVNNSTFTGNYAYRFGGGIYSEGTLSVSGSTFVNNNSATEIGTDSKAGQGGAIFSFGPTQISNSHFSNNSAYEAGGVMVNPGTITVDTSTFENNWAVYGSAIESFAGNLTVTNSTFTGNVMPDGTLGTRGAGIYNNGGNLTVKHSVFTNNSTSPTGFGGAIYNEAVGSGDFNGLTVTTSTFTGNFAQYGGAIYNDHTTATVRRSTFNDNEGSTGGGAIYNDTGTLDITNSTFTQNRAPGGNGGALYNLDGLLIATNSTIWGNTAFPSIFDGGGIYNDGNGVNLYNTIVANNSNYQCYDHAATLTADSHNIDDDGSCDNATQKTPAQIDLGVLKDNGGPTLTLKPSAASAALGAGDNLKCPAIDQRGITRPQGTTCDTGAVEDVVKPSN